MKKAKMTNRAVFLDRDDTLIEDPGYINDPGQVKLLEGVPKALKELRKMNFKLVIVSNQSGVARGIVTEEVLGKIHKKLEKLLANEGAYIDEIYYSPYHPEGAVEKYRKKSNCRKPEPGMLLQASEEMDIDLENSWIIGDSGRDIEAGKKVGCKTILLDPVTHEKKIVTDGEKPDYRAVNIIEAVNIIKHKERVAKNSHVRSEQLNKTTKKSESKAETETEKLKEKPVFENKNKNENEKQKTDVENNSLQENTNDPASYPEQKVFMQNILDQLKEKEQEKERFQEFSLLRLIAGIAQAFAIFCLILTVFKLTAADVNYNSVFATLGFAITLQMMSLTFYIMK